jgi:hypothetical protein
MQVAVDQVIRDADLNQCFQRVRVVGFSNRHTETAYRAQRAPSGRALQRELVASLNLAQDARRQRGYLLSARHFRKRITD